MADEISEEDSLLSDEDDTPPHRPEIKSAVENSNMGIVGVNDY